MAHKSNTTPTLFHLVQTLKKTFLQFTGTVTMLRCLLAMLCNAFWTTYLVDWSRQCQIDVSFAHCSGSKRVNAWYIFWQKDITVFAPVLFDSGGHKASMELINKVLLCKRKFLVCQTLINLPLWLLLLLQLIWLKIIEFVFWVGRSNKSILNTRPQKHSFHLLVC